MPLLSYGSRGQGHGPTVVAAREQEFRTPPRSADVITSSSWCQTTVKRGASLRNFFGSRTWLEGPTVIRLVLSQNSSHSHTLNYSHNINKVSPLEAVFACQHPGILLGTISKFFLMIWNTSSESDSSMPVFLHVTTYKFDPINVSNSRSRTKSGHREFTESQLLDDCFVIIHHLQS